MVLYFGIATIVFLMLFLILYFKNKAPIFTGFVFDIFLILLLITYIIYAMKQNTAFFNGTLAIIWFLFLIISFFGIYAIIVMLLLNAQKVFKKEKHSLSNSLTLLLAIMLIALCIFMFIMRNIELPSTFIFLWHGILAVFLFYFLHTLVFLTSVIICNISKPQKQIDYIIILGSGLIKNKISPLLKNRVDTAINLYKDNQKINKNIKLVLSGGKGRDEKISEAQAMKEYLLSIGIDENHILTEDKSKNTSENMLFSKKLIENDTNKEDYTCVFTTSNYHTLRASIYARRAGLDATGIGAKTAYYFLPNALIREYVAFFILYKKSFILMALLVFIFTFLFEAFF